MIYNLFNYFLAADLPALRRKISPVNLIPFPLYGSGLRKLRIFAATIPNHWLSAHSMITLGFAPFSEVVVTLISVGNWKVMLCEKPKDNSNN